jgi:VWFA-related protein
MIAQAPTQSDKGPVIRISVNLVQVDAVVTDSKGRQVTNLKPDDFEILEDGHVQKITNFSYFSTPPTSGPAGPASMPEAIPRVPPSPLGREQVNRTIAFVVDDLGLSFESTSFVRDTLKNFVEKQMRPGDLVAILRTSAGIGALQQFTSDRNMLMAAIRHVLWYPSGRAGIGAFSPIENHTAGTVRAGRSPRRATASRSAASAIDNREQEFRQDLYSVGTLGALNYIVRGLRDMPGRKSVILLSDGVPIFLSNDLDTRILESLRLLSDLANRSAVVIYSIDARGLPTLSLTAEDELLNVDFETFEQSLADRRQEYFDSQEGLEYLAAETGGFFVHDTNGLNLGIGRILDDLSGYYLIGYAPPLTAFDVVNNRRAFHRIQVKVKVAGLKVRSRTGYYGITDSDIRPVFRTRNEQLWAAITSPFGSEDIHLNLASLFASDARKGPLVRAILHIDARDLSIQELPDGNKQVVVDVTAILFGDKGQVIDGTDGTYTALVKAGDFASLKQKGLDYTLEVPVKKPGAYQVRSAVRDVSSKRVGSANQYIEVPDVHRGRLILSSIILNPTGDGESGPAVRRFPPGVQIPFVLQIYNAKLDRTKHAPDLVARFGLFRDGQQVFDTKPEPVLLEKQNDPKRAIVAGFLTLDSKLSPGDYVFQATITDKLAKAKRSTASQWTYLQIREPEAPQPVIP